MLVLDAVHGFGNQDEAGAKLGCDFVAAGTHKWIFAPRSTGIMWAPEKNWGLLRPTIPRDPALSAGIICFEVDGQTPDETVRRLLEHKVIASTSPYKISHARLAPSLVNDEGEVEAALKAVRAIV